MFGAMRQCPKMIRILYFLLVAFTLSIDLTSAQLEEDGIQLSNNRRMERPKKKSSKPKLWAPGTLQNDGKLLQERLKKYKMTLGNVSETTITRHRKMDKDKIEKSVSRQGDSPTDSVLNEKSRRRLGDSPTNITNETPEIGFGDSPMDRIKEFETILKDWPIDSLYDESERTFGDWPKNISEKTERRFGNFPIARTNEKFERILEDRPSHSINEESESRFGGKTKWPTNSLNEQLEALLGVRPTNSINENNINGLRDAKPKTVADKYDKGKHDKFMTDLSSAVSKQHPNNAAKDNLKLCHIIAATYMASLPTLKKYYHIRYFYQGNEQYETGYLVSDIITKYQKMLEIFYIAQDQYFKHQDREFLNSEHMLYLYTNVLTLGKTIGHMCSALQEIEVKYKSAKPTGFEDYHVKKKKKNGTKGKDEFYDLYKDTITALEKKRLRNKRLRMKKRKRDRKKNLYVGYKPTTDRTQHYKWVWPIVYGWSIEEGW